MKTRESRRIPDGPALEKVDDALSFMVMTQRYSPKLYYIAVHFDNKSYRWIAGSRKDVIERKTVRAHIQCCDHAAVQSLFKAPGVHATIHYGQLHLNHRRCTACGTSKCPAPDLISLT